MLIYQRGITLVELMIAGTIGLIAVSAATSIYQATATQTLHQLETLHLQSTAQGILELMSADIRRSGFWRVIPGKDKLKNNPFQSSGNDIRTGAVSGEPPDSCVIFSYDQDKDGKVGVGKCSAKGCQPNTDADNVEQFGFRLKKQTVQMRYAGKELGCKNGYWQALTDNSITVTDFKITLKQACLNLANEHEPCSSEIDRLIVRTAEINLSAHNARRKGIRVDLKRLVNIRNDRFIAAGGML